MNLGALFPSMPGPAAPEPAVTLITDPAPPTATAEPKAFYDHPSSQPVAAAPAEATPAPQTPAEASLYPSMDNTPPEVNPTVPAEIRELREADSDRKMYSAQTTYGDAVPEDLLASAIGVDGLTAETVQAATAEYREIAADAGLAPIEVKTFINEFKTAAAAPVTAEAQAAMRSASVKMLVETYGERAGSVLELTQAMVAKDHRVSTLLDQHGMGDRPQVVKMLAEAALRQATAGRLKPKK